MSNELRETIDRLKENVEFSNQFQNFKTVFGLISKHSDEFFRDVSLTCDLLDVILKILKNVNRFKNKKQYPSVSRTFLVFLTCINRSQNEKDQLEMIKKTNLFLDCVSNISHEFLICKIQPLSKLSNFFMRNLKNCLSYPYQEKVLKLWLRIFDHIKDENKKTVISAMKFTSNEKLNEKMKKSLMLIQMDNFEESSRDFLNQLNIYALKSTNIFSMKAKLLGINNAQLSEENIEHLWMDFNAGNLSISFSFKLECSTENKKENMKKCFVEILNYNTFECGNVVHGKTFQLLIEPTEYTVSCDMDENDNQLKICDVLIQLEDVPVKMELFEDKIFHIFKNRAKLERDDASSLVSFAGNESMLSFFTFNNSISEAPDSVKRLRNRDYIAKSVDRGDASKVDNLPQMIEIPETPVQREAIGDKSNDKLQTTVENNDLLNNNESKEEEENRRSAILFPSVELNTDELDALKKSSDKNCTDVVILDTPEESNVPVKENNANADMLSKIQNVLESDDESVIFRPKKLRSSQLISDDDDEGSKTQPERKNTKKPVKRIVLISDDDNSDNNDNHLVKNTVNEIVKNTRELHPRSAKQDPATELRKRKISESKNIETSNHTKYDLKSRRLSPENKQKASKHIFDFNETDDRDEFQPYSSHEKYKLEEPKKPAIQKIASKSPKKKVRQTKTTSIKAAPKKSTQTRRQTRNRKTEKISENGNQTFKMKDVKTKSMEKTKYAKFDDSSSDDEDEIIKGMKAKAIQVKPIRRSRRSVTKVAYEIEEYENIAKPPMQKRKRVFDELKKADTNQLSPRILRKLNPKKFEPLKSTKKEPLGEIQNSLDIEPMDFDVDDGVHNLDNPKQTDQLRVPLIIAQNARVKRLDEVKPIKKTQRKLTYSSPVKISIDPPTTIAVPKQTKQATNKMDVSADVAEQTERKSSDRPKIIERRSICTSPIIFDSPKKVAVASPPKIKIDPQKKMSVRRISIEHLSKEPRTFKSSNEIVYNMKELEKNLMLKRFVNAVSDGDYVESMRNLNNDDDNQEMDDSRKNDSDDGNSIEVVQDNMEKSCEAGEISVPQKSVAEKLKDAIVHHTYTAVNQLKENVQQTYTKDDHSSNRTYVAHVDNREHIDCESANLRMCRRGTITIVQEFNELECYSGKVKENNINDLKKKFAERYQKITDDKMKKLNGINFKKSSPKKISNHLKMLIGVRNNLRHKTKNYVELLREIQNARQELLYIQTMESSIVNEIFDTNHENILELKNNCKDYEEVVDEMDQVGVKALERAKTTIWNEYVDQGMNRIRDESRHLYEI